MNKRPPQRRRRRARPAESREGAAMLVVMLVLLATTSLAVFAVQATSYEVRASGFARQSMQAEYVAESGLTSTLALVDRIGPQAILHAVDQQQVNSLSTPKATMQPFEPEMEANTEVYRMLGEDMTTFTGGVSPVEVASLGPNQAYTPSFTVDIYDYHITQRPVAGYRVDGGGLSFFHATYTSRGRMRLTAGDRTISGPDTREYHETASGARAYGVSGPFAQ